MRKRLLILVLKLPFKPPILRADGVPFRVHSRTEELNHAMPNLITEVIEKVRRFQSELWLVRHIDRLA